MGGQAGSAPGTGTNAFPLSLSPFLPAVTFEGRDLGCECGGKCQAHCPVDLLSAVSLRSAQEADGIPEAPEARFGGVETAPGGSAALGQGRLAGAEGPATIPAQGSRERLTLPTRCLTGRQTDRQTDHTF